MNNKSTTEESSELKGTIREMQTNFSEIQSDYISQAQVSKSSFAHFYYDLAENYSDAVNICELYLTGNEDIVSFIEKMIDLGFSLEVLRLKSKLQNLIALKKIEKIEKEIRDEQEEYNESD